MNQQRSITCLVLLIFTLIFSGCSLTDPLTIFKGNEQVQSFLEQYPNAEITVIKLNADLIEKENTFVNDICGISLEPKDHYKITMNDKEAELEFYGYIDIETQEIICLKKMGNEYNDAQKELEEVKEEDAGENMSQQNNQHQNKECNSDAHLEGKNIDGRIILEWSKNDCSDFQGYKVVWSPQTDDPKYPEDGYIKYITNRDTTRFEVPAEHFKDGKNWYRITTLTTNGINHHSNVLKFYNENYQESQDDDSQYKYKEFDLDSNFDDDGNLILKWDKYTDDNFQYYKVVWSQETGNIKYPEDGYITAISNQDTTEFKVPEDKFKDGKNYYRITVATSNYYAGDNDARAYSNYIKIEKGEEDAEGDVELIENKDCELMNYDNSFCVDNLPDFKEKISEYDLTNYNKKNWEYECHNQIENKTTCIKLIRLEYYNSNTSTAIHVMPTIIEEGKEVYLNYIFENLIKEEISNNTYRLTEPWEIFWKTEDDFDFIITQTYNYSEQNDSSQDSSPITADINNDVIQYFLTHYNAIK